MAMHTAAQRGTIAMIKLCPHALQPMIPIIGITAPLA